MRHIEAATRRYIREEVRAAVRRELKTALRKLRVVVVPPDPAPLLLLDEEVCDRTEPSPSSCAPLDEGDLEEFDQVVS
jgi:hypothetical protein